jgi:hypothetical protein
MGDLIRSARSFAASHSQRITISREPGLQTASSHLKSVAQIVASVSQDEKAIAAAWLHDIVEDTGVTIGDIEREFGVEVAKLVGEVSVFNEPVEGNQMGSAEFVTRHFAHASAEAKTIKLADLIDTCNDLYKCHPAALRAYAAQANELAAAFEGGDASLLERLARDLKKYAAASLPVESAAPRFRPLAVPVAALRLVESAVSARHIAEPLISFDSNSESKEVLEAMAVAKVEVAGIYTKGIIWGFVEANSLGEGRCEKHGRAFAPSQVVASRSPLTDVIEVLTRHDWCFVSVLGNVGGVISRRDLHGPAARMWLFGIITVAELEFTERIRQKWPDDTWVGLLSPQRIERANQLRTERERRRGKCQLLDCLQLSDKMEILMSDPAGLKALGIFSSSAARKASNQIESLRNSLAHAQDFAEQDWPQVVRLARRIQHLAAES